MYYVREEYTPWEPVQSKTLRGAKVAATKRAAYKGTRVEVGIKEGDRIRRICGKPMVSNGWKWLDYTHEWTDWAEPLS